MCGKTPTFQHANGASIRARAVPLRILIPRAQRLSTCISRPTASVVGIPCAVVALRGRKRGHFGKKCGVKITKNAKRPSPPSHNPFSTRHNTQEQHKNNATQYVANPRRRRPAALEGRVLHQLPRAHQHGPSLIGGGLDTVPSMFIAAVQQRAVNKALLIGGGGLDTHCLHTCCSFCAGPDVQERSLRRGVLP